ncbi:MAG: glycosyltransferase family 4 protein [Chlorobium sp.]|nr:glycosyltransferase family 4 protein [Chlorobium sp.]
MRILHFLNIPITNEQLKLGGDKINTSGGWMAVLLARLLKHSEITLGCAAFGAVNKLQTLQEGRVTSFVMQAALNGTECGLNLCRDIVNEWKPDLIHIHGTENSFGLLATRGLVNCPVVISIQGLLGPCSEWYRYFGNRSLTDIFSMHRWLEIPALRGHWLEFFKTKKMAKVERECIAGNRFFIGRTAWDRAYVKALNPSAHYYYGGELLREPFWLKRWSISNAKRHRLIFTNAGHPRKGAQVVFDAVKLLQPDYPAIQVAIAGVISQRSGYGRYIRKKMNSLGHAAIELGPLNAEQMANELVASHVFVSPSFIENSSNASCEAQLMGMPVISSYTGGMPSLIQDGTTGLFFPTGDAPMLAARLQEVFEDDDLASRLGAQAREVASRRHDPDLVLQGILDVYEDVMRQEQ